MFWVDLSSLCTSLELKASRLIPEKFLQHVNNKENVGALLVGYANSTFHMHETTLGSKTPEEDQKDEVFSHKLIIWVFCDLQVFFASSSHHVYE